jgi:peroxiredoxin Q/BCP
VYFAKALRTLRLNKKMTTLKKGDKAPDFSGLDQDGNAHKLQIIKEKISFLLSKSKYSGCTAEACDLRDNFERFKANNYELLG